MHFGVCFFCVLLASESSVTAMPLPSVRNVLEPQQIKDKKSELSYTAPRLILPEGSMPDSVQNEADYNSYKSLRITNNGVKSPTSEYHGSSNTAVRDDSASFPSLFLDSPKFKLNTLSKGTEERNVRTDDYSNDYINAVVQDRSTNKVAPMNKLLEPGVPNESSSETEVKDVARGTANLENIPSIMSAEMVKPVDEKLKKTYDEGQNILDTKFEGREKSASMDKVSSGFAQQETSQLNYEKKDEYPLDEGEQERAPLRRKQRRKRNMHVLGYDTSDILGEPENENFLQNDIYGLESSTQFSFLPNPSGISYENGRDTYLDVGGINSPEVNEGNKYVPNLSLNSIQGDAAAQNGPPFQLSRPFNHKYQRFSSLTDSANDIPSNTYLTGNSYQSEIMPELPAEPSNDLTSSSDENTMSFNKYLTENDNIRSNSQEVQPHEAEIKYLTDNHDKDYEKKYSYNDEMSYIPNQNDVGIYPGLYKHNSYVGDSVVSDLSDSYPSEREKQFTYNNYIKTTNFRDNRSHRDYSGNRDIQEKYVEGDNNIDNNRGYFSDNEIPSSAEQRYSYNYPGLSDSNNYQGASSQIVHNPDINEIEMRDSNDFSPVNFMSQSKFDDLPPRLGHFTSYVRPTIMDSDFPRNSQYDSQNNIRENLFKRYKNPMKYVSIRRNSPVSPYTQDNEYAAFHPRQRGTQDSMIVYDYTDSDSDNKSHTNKKTQRKSKNESHRSCTKVSNRQMALKRHSTEDKADSCDEEHPQKMESDSAIRRHSVGDTQRRVHAEKGSDVTFDPLKCLEEGEPTEEESTESTTLSVFTETTTVEEVKEEKEEKEEKEKEEKEKEEKEEKGEKKHPKKTNHTSTFIHNAVPVCKTDFPCSVTGVWYSHTGGVLLSIQANKDANLNVHILKPPSYYKGNGILSDCWNITGEMPFYPRMKSFISLNAIENDEHKYASFLGECFTCEGVDVIYGSWLLGRPARSCSDQHISTIEYKDVLKKSHLHSLRNCKKIKIKRKHHT